MTTPISLFIAFHKQVTLGPQCLPFHSFSLWFSFSCCWENRKEASRTVSKCLSPSWPPKHFHTEWPPSKSALPALCSSPFHIPGSSQSPTWDVDQKHLHLHTPTLHGQLWNMSPSSCLTSCVTTCVYTSMPQCLSTWPKNSRTTAPIHIQLNPSPQLIKT